MEIEKDGCLPLLVVKLERGNHIPSGSLRTPTDTFTLVHVTIHGKGGLL